MRTWSQSSVDVSFFTSLRPPNSTLWLDWSSFGRFGPVSVCSARRRKPLGDLHDRHGRKIDRNVVCRVQPYVAHGARTGAKNPPRHRKAGQSTASRRQWHDRRRGELKSKRERIVTPPRSTTAE